MMHQTQTVLFTKGCDITLLDQDDIDAALPLELRWINPGTFYMGADPHDPGAILEDGPRFPVTLTHGYWLGTYPITEAHWQAIMGLRRPRSCDLPATRISWFEATMFTTALNKRWEKSLPPGARFRLPTEAEWEYACRANRTSNSNQDEAWYVGNSNESIHPVGQLQPNPWGLHDMLGNVWEWCWDAVEPYTPAPAINRLGQASPELRMVRGGCYLSSLEGGLSAATRGAIPPSTERLWVGLRICLAWNPQFSNDFISRHN